MLEHNERKYISIDEAQRYYWEKRRHPFHGGFELTVHCNLRCVHCYLNNTEKSQDLTTEEVKEIIDKLYRKGILFLYFTGGEVFIRPDFLEIYAYAKSLGFIVDILSNGTLIDNKVVEYLRRDPPARLSLSMYGFTEETYDKITQTKGSHKKFMEAITRIATLDIYKEIKYIVMKDNFSELKLAKAFAETMGFEFVSSFELFPTLEGSTEVQENMLTSDEIIKYEQHDELLCKKWSVNVNKQNPYALLENEDIPLFTCNIGKTEFSIDHQGYLNPCNKLRLQEHNLLSEDFDVGWNEFSKYKKMRISEKNKCAKCKYLYICHTCPIQNYLSTGDFEEPDKFACELTQKRGREFSQKKYDKFRK